MSSSTTPRSSPVDDSGQETSPLLAGYRQTVVASTASGTQHASSNTAVAKYNGTWNRGKIIGGGKFSEVFLSQEASSRQVRAVKEIMRGRSDWVDREIQCMIVLQNFSDLFVGIQCWYRYMDRTFIAMDYYPLGDLTRQVVTSGPFDEPVARDIAEQILHAVFVLHKHNLVHRDIKPQNIMIASVSPVRIRLADFGIARDLPGASLIGDDDGLGTADWAAPEQLDQYSGLYSNKVDMWAVGCVVYYLLTSLNPFSDRDADHDPAIIARYRYHFWPRLLRRDFYHTDERSPGYAITVRGASAAANRFLHALIVRDPQTRLSAFDALRQTWVNPTRIHPVGLALIRGNGPLATELELHMNHGITVHLSPTLILRVAAAHGHLNLVRRALGCCDMRGTAVFENDVGADILRLRTEPALVGAAGNGNVKIVKLLIAKLNYTTVREWQRVLRLALDRALRRGHSEVVEILWRLVSDVYRASSEELNILIARFGTPAFLDSVYMYLHGKTTLSETESAPGGFLPGMPASNLHIQSMLLAATHEGNTANIDTLLSRVFGTSSPSLSTSAKILLKAAEAGHLRIVEVISALLRSYSGPPTELDPTHSFPTALTIAAQNGHIDVVRFLLKEVVMPDIAALNGAVINNHTAVFRLLVTALLQIYGFTAQQVIASIDSRAIPHCGVNLLAAHPDRASLSAALELHVGAAARLGHLDVVEWLLENVPARGRDLSDAVSEGLVGAAERGHVEIVQCLCSWRGGTVNVTRALKRAAVAGHVDVLEILLACGPSWEAVKAALRAAGAAEQMGAEMRLRMGLRMVPPVWVQ